MTEEERQRISDILLERMLKKADSYYRCQGVY